VICFRTGSCVGAQRLLRAFLPAMSSSIRLRGPAFELTNKKLTDCLIYRKPGLEVRIRLTDQLQRIQVSQKVENGLLLKAARKIQSGVLEPFADFFPPTHC
jgi:hypothetical protein